ncbi:hypothetical protein C8Q73DRAFT_19306 [Cubamyces lactineus]|nr:hypothetical protein C8Q73DRAFT_19306 [Cubamyces lactineus]
MSNKGAMNNVKSVSRPSPRQAQRARGGHDRSHAPQYASRKLPVRVRGYHEQPAEPAQAPLGQDAAFSSGSHCAARVLGLGQRA